MRDPNIIDLSAYRSPSSANSARHNARPAPEDAIEEPEEELPPAASSPFPTHALPEVVRTMVAEASLETLTPESLCAAAGLGIASAAIGAAVRVESGPGRTTPANIFVLAFARSGAGKGRSFNVMARPYFEAGSILSQTWRECKRPGLKARLAVMDKEMSAAKNNDNESEIARLIAEEESLTQELLREPRWNFGNATAEALAEGLANSKSEAGAILTAEGRDVVQNLLGRYSAGGKGSDEPIFLQAWSNDFLEVTRKGKPPLRLDSPSLTMFCAVQPDVWQMLAGDDRMMQSGFLARSLTFDSKALPQFPTGYAMSAAASAKWSEAVESMMSLRDDEMDRTVIPTPEAHGIINRLDHKTISARLPGGEWEWCESHAARLAENAWRLSLIMHCVAHPSAPQDHKMSAETAGSAVEIAEWFFGRTLELLAPVRGRKSGQRLERLIEILRQAGGEVTTARLAKHHSFESSELISLAEEFPKRIAILQKSPGPQGGRKSSIAKLIS